MWANTEIFVHLVILCLLCAVFFIKYSQIMLDRLIFNRGGCVDISGLSAY